jgi:hypothetical protein
VEAGIWKLTFGCVNCRNRRIATCRDNANNYFRRSRVLRATTRSTNAACPLATIPSLLPKTASTHIASTTSIGVRIQRKSRSTSTVLSTSRSRKHHRTHWRRKVSEHISVYSKEEKLLTVVQSSKCRSLSPRSRTSKAILLSASEHTGTQPRAQTRASSGGASSSSWC